MLIVGAFYVAPIIYVATVIYNTLLMNRVLKDGLKRSLVITSQFANLLFEVLALSGVLVLSVFNRGVINNSYMYLGCILIAVLPLLLYLFKRRFLHFGVLFGVRVTMLIWFYHIISNFMW